MRQLKLDKGAVFIEHYFRDKICFESNLTPRGVTPHFIKSSLGHITYSLIVIRAFIHFMAGLVWILSPHKSS